MDLQHYVVSHFDHSMAAQRDTLSAMAPGIARAGAVMAESLLQGGRIISCGSGSSGSLAQQLALALVHRFDRERPGLPALCISTEGHLLTAIAGDLSLREVYASQIKTLGQETDVLVMVCAGRTSRSILEAIKAGHDRDMKVIALTGPDGDEIADLLQSSDVELRVSAQSAAAVQETHLIMINSLCALIDTQIFGDQT